jgi:hypothetical protein
MTCELLVPGDLHLTLQFQAGNGARGAVLILPEEEAGARPAGPRVEFTGGGRVVLFGKDGGRLLHAAATAVQADAWHKLEVVVAGKRLQVLLNGKQEVATDSAQVPARSVIALEGPAAAGQQLRFRHLDVRLPSDKK